MQLQLQLTYSRSTVAAIIMEGSSTQIKVADVIEERYRPIFRHQNFNEMQSIVLEQCLQSDDNMVVAAPTGSGKTVIHELAIVRLISQHASHGGQTTKSVFIAPNKALCQQRMREWKQKFANVNQTVLEVTGDVDMRDALRSVAKATIIVTTPEKWDSLTRCWKDHIFLLGAIDLLLIDEVHHLGEDRGSTLETIVVRMKMLNKVFNSKLKSDTYRRLRIIALSATLPNLVDIGDWLECSHNAIHYFDESYRPVPLTVHTLSMGTSNNAFLFDKSLDDRVSQVIVRYSEGKQTLIFCPSKKSTEILCSKLCQSLQIPISVTQRARQNVELIEQLQDRNLQKCLYRGVAYHHSGVPADDRAIVEELYTSRSIHVLCSTSTLAHGVNLPAHLVIIKGTKCWRGGSRGYENTSKSDIIQMLGRAGRPGFDDHGVAVIMTSQEDRAYYGDVSLGAEVVESTLPKNLTEAICAEITQAVITSRQSTVEWIKSTFFFFRVRKAPAKYGFNQEVPSEEGLDMLLTEMCTKAVKDLSDAGIVAYNSDLQTIEPNAEAHIMTRSLIKFRTMKLLIELPPATTLDQLIRNVSQSEELDKPVRRLEKRVLNDIMKAVRYPLKLRVQEPAHKSYVLMQAAVGRIDIKDFALRVEQAEVVESSLRVLGALKELAIERKHGPLLENTLQLDRALRSQMWETNYGSVFQQCPGLNVSTRNSLAIRGVRHVGDVEYCSPQKVQEMMNCSQEESRNILFFAKMLYQAWMEVASVSTMGSSLSIHIKVTHAVTQRMGIEIDYPVYQLIVYDTSNSRLICHRRIEKGCQQVVITVSVPQDLDADDVKCILLSNYVGIDHVRHAKERDSTVQSTENDSIKAGSSKSVRHTAALRARGLGSRSAIQQGLAQKMPTQKAEVGTVTPHPTASPAASKIRHKQTPITAFTTISPSSGNGPDTNPPGIQDARETPTEILHPLQRPGPTASVYPSDITNGISPMNPFVEFEFSHMDYSTSLKDGGTTVEARGGGLDTVRMKGKELELDRIPMKRLRPNFTAGSSTSSSNTSNYKDRRCVYKQLPKGQSTTENSDWSPEEAFDTTIADPPCFYEIDSALGRGRETNFFSDHNYKQPQQEQEGMAKQSMHQKRNSWSTSAADSGTCQEATRGPLQQKIPSIEEKGWATCTNSSTHSYRCPEQPNLTDKMLPTAVSEVDEFDAIFL